jgi:hypothetical protein
VGPRGTQRSASLVRMATESLTRLARLLHERNIIDEKISQIIDRPTTAGHAGEWIAAHVF